MVFMAQLPFLSSDQRCQSSKETQSIELQWHQCISNKLSVSSPRWSVASWLSHIFDTLLSLKTAIPVPGVYHIRVKENRD